MPTRAAKSPPPNLPPIIVNPSLKPQGSTTKDPPPVAGPIRGDKRPVSAPKQPEAKNDN